MVTDGLKEFGFQLARRDARLSELARRVMAAAEQFAAHQNDVLPGMGHLLLALYREQRSSTSYLLRASHLVEARLLRLLDDEAVIALTGFDEVLVQAVDYADRLGSHFVGTEHLLLALVLDPAGTELLEQVGAPVDDLRERVSHRLSGTDRDA
jgi:ATP-dependent Clp protease ATP-binding subunit ClpC